MVFGEWARFERRLTEGLACLARASAENLSLPQDAIDENAIAFRYERNLISGADITEWLDARRHLRPTPGWRLSPVACSASRGATTSRTSSIATARRRGNSRTRRSRKASARSLRRIRASRSVARPRPRSTSDAAPFNRGADVGVTRVTQPRAWHASTRTGWRGAPASIRSRVLRVLLEIKDLYCAATEKLVTEAALLEVIEANRLEWVVIDTDTLSFADESAAREALLCVSEDRLSLADVGALSRHRDHPHARVPRRRAAGASTSPAGGRTWSA